jgi:murein peptide amidase A
MRMDSQAGAQYSGGMERLGRNKGRYCGESIEVQRILNEIQSEALKTGWRSDCFLKTDQFSLLAYERRTGSARKRLYLSTGIHGDEPAGPLAILQLLRQNRWPEGLEIWLCPCLNPLGFESNRRENALGIDLNRDYRHLLTEEVRAHVGWLQQQPIFDLTLILHEDWEAGGFYLYELNPDHLPSFAEPMIEAVAKVCPIEPAELVDNWPARGGIIRPQVHPKDRPQWPEAIYLINSKTRRSYTLETPSDFPLATRVTALCTAVQTAMERL